jgi:predicted ATPase
MWNPTNALDASLDTLVTDEDCHNNLEQFLKNFRTYIALRLADNGSGKTLTLSAAVFSSIWDANGNPQVLQDGLDQLRADIHNIVKTTKHWDVNKAN